MLLRERLKADLKTAMKSRDRPTITTLRTLLGAFDNAEAVETSAAPVVGRPNDVPRKDLSEAEFYSVLGAEAEELRTERAAYRALGQSAKVAELEHALSVVERYLEPALGREAGE